jgi:hypothetical protein
LVVFISAFLGVDLFSWQKKRCLVVTGAAPSRRQMAGGAGFVKEKR